MTGIGVPKEIKDNEGRVGLTPSAVEQLRAKTQALCHSKRCKIRIETGAGELSGYSDRDYTMAGADIVNTPEEVFAQSRLIVKVKEPMPREFHLLKSRQGIFTFLHLAANPEMAEEFSKKKILGISYDTIMLDNGKLLILEPMSEIAGKRSIVEGLKINPHIKNVTVLGYGAVGAAAVAEALRHNLSVRVLEKDKNKLAELKKRHIMVGAIKSNKENLYQVMGSIDLLVGAVLLPGGEAPKLITGDMARIMRDGAVIVDVSIDQGGICDFSEVTTHSSPTKKVGNIIYYGVANMPGCVPKESTPALVEASLPFLLEILKKGIAPAQILHWSGPLKRGINTYGGYVTHKGAARDLGRDYMPLELAVPRVN